MKCPSPTVSPNVSASWTSLADVMPGAIRMDLPSVASYTPLPLSMIGIPMRPALSALLVTLTTGMGAMEVDQRWWHPTDSHHFQHAVAGAGVGFVVDGLLQFTGTPRWQRVTVATSAALVVGVAIEYADPGNAFRARRDGAHIDPADIGWTALGGLLGAATAEITGSAIRFHLSPSTLAASVSWKF